MTLVEVLVSVVILFAGIVAIMRVYSGVVSLLDASEATLAATLTLQQQLESVALTPAGDEGLTGNRRVAQAVSGYTGRITRRPLARDMGVGLAECRVEAVGTGRRETEQVVTWAVTVLP